MKLLLLILLFFSSGLPITDKTSGDDTFLNQQLKYARVKAAWKKYPELKKQLQKAGVKKDFQLFIRAFKNTKKLEVWVKASDKKDFQLFKIYDFCALSGSLGPKRHENDGQVPEGFYSIDRFNPASNFHLSLGINYPNTSDKILGKAPYGEDIFIHGNCVTIGCIPLTNEKIEEVYLLAILAKSAGQKNIAVHIFPFEMILANLKTAINQIKTDKKLVAFWTNLADGYQYFQDHQQLPQIKVNTAGQYSYL